VSDRLIDANAIATMVVMNRKPLMGALLIAAASLIATGAYADNKPGDKGSEKKAEKADDKAGKDDKKAGEDRGAKKAKEHEALKEKLKAKLKAAPDAAVKEELRRHAERIAKLERIKTVADGEKDTATSAKATTLMDKENARHDKWMDKHLSGGAMPTTATPTTASGTPTTATPTTAAPATSGGAK
jgi:hypothetical protein